LGEVEKDGLEQRLFFGEEGEDHKKGIGAA
jgi:hypothetical protein